MKTFLILLLAAAGLAACASFDGRGLVPGQAKAQDVEKLMGRPAEVERLAGGGELWFYTRTPYGRRTYAVRLAPDGSLVSIEQRLTKENFAKIVPGQSKKQDVHALLGPPWKAYRTRDGFEEWDYLTEVDMRWFDFLVDFSDDGIARRAWLLHDPIYDTGNGKD